jgi:hypothetical protein
MDSIQEEIITAKTLDFLVSHANVTDAPAAGDTATLAAPTTEEAAPVGETPAEAQS